MLVTSGTSHRQAVDSSNVAHQKETNHHQLANDQ